jgi:hypothetical protein
MIASLISYQMAANAHQADDQPLVSPYLSPSTHNATSGLAWQLSGPVDQVTARSLATCVVKFETAKLPALSSEPRRPVSRPPVQIVRAGA